MEEAKDSKEETKPPKRPKRSAESSCSNEVPKEETKPPWASSSSSSSSTSNPTSTSSSTRGQRAAKRRKLARRDRKAARAELADAKALMADLKQQQQRLKGQASSSKTASQEGKARKGRKATAEGDLDVTTQALNEDNKDLGGLHHNCPTRDSSRAETIPLRGSVGRVGRGTNAAPPAPPADVAPPLLPRPPFKDKSLQAAAQRPQPTAGPESAKWGDSKPLLPAAKEWKPKVAKDASPVPVAAGAAGRVQARADSGTSASSSYWKATAAPLRVTAAQPDGPDAPKAAGAPAWLPASWSPSRARAPPPPAKAAVAPKAKGPPKAKAAAPKLGPGVYPGLPAAVAGHLCACCSVRPRRFESRFCCGICEKFATEPKSARSGYHSRHGGKCTWKELSFIEFNSQRDDLKHFPSDPDFWT